MDIMFLKNLTVGRFNLNTQATSFVTHVQSDNPIFTDHITVPFDFYIHGSEEEDEHFLIIPDNSIKPTPNWSKQVYFHEQLIDVVPGTAQLFVFSFKKGPLDALFATSLAASEQEIVRGAFSVE